MDNYVTGAAVRSLREAKGITQEELAESIHVSAKAVSKWETGKGFPDVSLLEPLAAALGISVIELLSGEAVVSCCGITLPPQEAEEADAEHRIRTEIVEDEYFVTLQHPMTKEHFISFLMAVSDRGTQFVKLYPEGNAEARFKINGVKALYAYCNRHGLFRYETGNRRKKESAI